ASSVICVLLGGWPAYNPSPFSEEEAADKSTGRVTATRRRPRRRAESPADHGPNLTRNTSPVPLVGPRGLPTPKSMVPTKPPARRRFPFASTTTLVPA